MVTRFRQSRLKTLSLTVCYLTVTACQPTADVGGNSASTTEDATGNPALRAVARRHASPSTADYPDSGVDLGWGWDTELGVAKPTVCIEFSIDHDKGQTKRLSVTEVSDSYEVMKSMGLSAAVSVKTIGYKVSGKASFAKDSKVSGYSSNFVMRAAVDNGVWYAAPMAGKPPVNETDDRQMLRPHRGAIRLTPQALKLAKQKNLNAFNNVCGDSFVSALYGGAELIGVISIQTKSRQESEKASTSFSGSGWGVDVSGKATASAFSKFNSEQMSLRFFQTGGSRDKIPAAKEDFLAKLDSLSAEAEDAPKFYRVSLLPYSALENWPEKELFIATAELDQLAGFWGDYVTLYHELEEILQHPEQFCTLSGCPKAQTLEQTELGHYADMQDEVQAELRRLHDAALHCTHPDPGPDETCQFNEAEYLSVFAYRVQLPLRLDQECTPVENPTRCQMIISKAQKEDTKNQILREQVIDPVNSRCRISPLDAGCLSNREVELWKARLNQQLVLLDQSSQVNRLRMLQAAAKDSPEVEDWYEAYDQPPHVWVSNRQDRASAKQAIFDLLTAGQE